MKKDRFAAGVLLMISGGVLGAQTLFSAADFGAVPNDGKSDIAAFQQAFKACAAADGPVVLKIAPGVYDFPGEAVNSVIIDRCNELTIEADGAVVAAGKTTPFYFRNCEKLTVKGLTIRSVWKNFSVGTLIDKGDDYLTIRFDAADHITAATPIQNFQDYDRASSTVIGNLDIFSPNVSKAEDVGADTVRYTLKGVSRNESRKAEYFRKAMETLPVGTEFVARHEVYSGYGLDFLRCSEVTVDGVTVNSMTGFAAKFIECRDVALKNFTVEPDKNSARRHLSTSGDCVMMLYLEGSLLVENTRILHGGDDSLTVMTKYIEGEELVDRRTLRAFIKTGWQGATPQRGDTLVFRNRRTLAVSGSAVVEKAKWDGAAKRWTITFAEDLPETVRPDDVASNTRYLPSVTIRDSVFGDGRARGVILDAHDILLENNTFRGTGMPGVKIWTETQVSIDMGPPSENVVIRNNRFIDCGMVPLLVYAGAREPAGVHRNITIENNLFDSNGPLNKQRMKRFLADHPYWASAIYLRGVEDVRITGNRFLGYENAIFASYTDNLLISGNTSDIASEVRLAPTVSDVKFTGNTMLSEIDNYQKAVEGVSLYSYLR